MKLKKLLSSSIVFALCVSIIPNVQKPEILYAESVINFSSNTSAGVINRKLNKMEASTSNDNSIKSGVINDIKYTISKSEDNSDMINVYIDGQNNEIPKDFMSSIGYISYDIDALYITNALSINEGAFSNIKYNYILLADNVMSVESYSFKNCGSSIIYLSNSIEYVSPVAFECSGKSYIVAENNRNFFDYDGCLYTYNSGIWGIYTFAGNIGLSNYRGIELVDVPSYYENDIVVPYGTKIISSYGICDYSGKIIEIFNPIKPEIKEEKHIAKIILPETIEYINPIDYDYAIYDDYCFGAGYIDAEGEKHLYNEFNVYIPKEITYIENYVNFINDYDVQLTNHNQITVNNFDSDGGICGDSNLDGNLTSEDALTILQYIVGNYDFENYYQIYSMDANLDGEYTAEDALAVLQKTVGL